MRGPLLAAEARLRGLRQRPHTEVLGPGDVLAVKVVAALARQGQPEGVDVQAARLARDRARSRRRPRRTRSPSKVLSVLCCLERMQASGTRLVLNESDVYREFAPPAWARTAIACFWLRRGDGGSVRVLPDACADIVWRPGAGAMIAGPDSEAWTSRTRPGELIVGARLLPGAGGAAFGIPLAEVRNARVPVDALGLDPRDELSGALDPDDAPAARRRGRACARGAGAARPRRSRRRRSGCSIRPSAWTSWRGRWDSASASFSGGSSPRSGTAPRRCSACCGCAGS